MMTRGELIKILGIEKEVDTAIPKSFQDCLLYGATQNDESLVEYCGYDADPHDFVWDYRGKEWGKNPNGSPLHLGEEILTQLGEGDIFILTKDEMIEFENLRADKRRGN